MRQALLALALLTATGCGVMPRQAQRPATDVHWPAVAEATRQQWYRGVEQGTAEPVSLSENNLDAALETGRRPDAGRNALTRQIPYRHPPSPSPQLGSVPFCAKTSPAR